MAKLIILRGYPGSGKTTVGKRLSDENVGTFIDHSSILTFIANIAGNDDGIYEDIASLELAITQKLLKEQKSVIIARGFSSPESLQQYENVAVKLGIKPIIFRLNVDHTILSNRVASSERLGEFNPTATKEALDVWIENNSLVDHPLEKVIDNSQSLDKTVAEIISKI